MPLDAAPISRNEKEGLYDPRNEHDACGVAFVTDIKGRRSHKIIHQGLEVLKNLDHRGAVGADPTVGDGSGCLIQTPDKLLRKWAYKEKLELPPEGKYAVAMTFLPQDEAAFDAARKHFEETVVREGQSILGWRQVPTNPEILGEAVKTNMPRIWQAIVVPNAEVKDDRRAFERKLLVIRKQVETAVAKLAEQLKLPGLNEFYIPSFSTRTVDYKGLVLAPQLGDFFRDLLDPDTESALAMVHQRFSTNTFPSWRLAHPYRFISHNGEINTNRGNVNWMHARQGAMASDLLGADLQKLYPLIKDGQSDTANIDNAAEFLTIAGDYPLAEAMMMLIPNAWENDGEMAPPVKAFYRYNSSRLEPWDGPAAIAFTDGRQIGAILDRNGLRPARYVVTDDDMLILASEVGVLPIPEQKIVKKWRLEPGKILLVDLEKGEIIDDAALKAALAAKYPYERLVREGLVQLKDLPAIPSASSDFSNEPNVLLHSKQMYGYTDEDDELFLRPMGEDGDDPVGSMGTDTPIAAISAKAKLLYNYFKQNFAQVTNPPIDPIREARVMSLRTMLGARPNLLDRDPKVPNLIELEQPILTNQELANIRAVGQMGRALSTDTIDATWHYGELEDGLAKALDRICQEAEVAVLAGKNIIVISDRNASHERIPIPSLLATSAVHHHLIRKGLRTKAGLVVETGEARQVHHFSVLAGYGAEAINPYLAFDALEALRAVQRPDIDAHTMQKNYIKAAGKGILKVMSKMGISTYQSYCGAQIFDAVGLNSEFVEKYFTGTATTNEGSDLRIIAQ